MWKFATNNGQTDGDGQRTPSDVKSSYDLCPGELKRLAKIRANIMYSKHNISTKYECIAYENFRCILHEIC
jgi:hypothetical protein